MSQITFQALPVTFPTSPVAALAAKNLAGRQPDVGISRLRNVTRWARKGWAGALAQGAAAVDPIDAIETQPWRAAGPKEKARAAAAGALSMGASMLTIVGALASALAPAAGGPLIAVGMGAWMASSLARPQAAGGRINRVAGGLKMGAAAMGAVGGAALACPGVATLAGAALLGAAAVLALASFVCLVAAHRDGGLRRALQWATADLTGLPSLHRREQRPPTLPGS